MYSQQRECEMYGYIKSNRLIYCTIKLYTAAFTYYYDPAILRNKLTPLSIFGDLALRKRDSNK